MTVSVESCTKTGSGWLVTYRVRGERHAATSAYEVQPGQDITIIDGVVQ